MLNRRNLRIKVMQSLFAYEQCCEADYELAKAYLVDRFSPDLNSMEVQDKELLKSRQQASLELFEKQFKGKTVNQTEEIVEQEVEIALKNYNKNSETDLRHLKKETITHISQLEQVYHSVLCLFPAMAIAAGNEKRINHQSFIDHSIIRAIGSNAELSKSVKNPSVGWDTRMDLVRSWFREVVKKDAQYQEFILKTKPGIEEELTFLRYLLRKIILGETVIGSFFESEHLHWAEDKEIIRGLTEKTIKTIKTEQGFQLQKLSLEWEEDKFFVEQLFDRSANLPERFHKLIASNTVNWEVERLPLTDRVILQMAIAEFITFPNVPIKVTINEYIELAKEYSTPKSRQFINGILDVLARELKKSGDLKKSGRGLIDNK